MLFDVIQRIEIVFEDFGDEVVLPLVVHPLFFIVELFELLVLRKKCLHGIECPHGKQ